MKRSLLAKGIIMCLVLMAVAFIAGCSPDKTGSKNIFNAEIPKNNDTLNRDKQNTTNQTTTTSIAENTAPATEMTAPVVPVKYQPAPQPAPQPATPVLSRLMVTVVKDANKVGVNNAIRLGDSAPIAVEGIDQYGNLMAININDVKFSTDNGNIVGSNFVSTTEGNATITATLGSVTGNTVVVVLKAVNLNDNLETPYF